ncbi:hypothetical protein H261_08813 [Paramagnetospirillum caucaseum]|uniref:Uncharacterized protein n=1 Tax=Paramagnetospirillum caucaseum TaxID=1244869 RepID=M3ACM5_9PROT|nr:hypothetical protein H261_08813 [Paramagnetospirillum caucaseum]
MSRFCDGSLHIEVEYRFGSTGPFLSQSPPPSVAGAIRTIPHGTMPNEIDIDMIAVSGPMSMEIIKEGRPIRRQTMHFKISERKREAVIDANQGRHLI